MARTLLQKRADGAAMHGVMPLGRKGEESMMNMHGRTSGPVAALVRQDAVVLSQLLLRPVTATMVMALALFLVQPANAQSPKVAFAIPHSGTLKKINDSGEIRIGYRENSPPFAFLDAQRKPLG